MDHLEQLHILYDTYEKRAQTVRKKASRYAGAFGLGDDPRSHGCHEMFYEDVACWAQDFLDSDPSQQEVFGAVRFIFEAADAHRDNTDIFGYLYAVQGHTRDMIPLLSGQMCMELLEWYDRTYPADERLPVQLEIVSLLQKQTGTQPAPKRGLLRFFTK